MAGTQRPSFLKRQKEQKRLSRALDKRQAKQARREARGRAPDGAAADVPGAGMPLDPDAGDDAIDAAEDETAETRETADDGRGA